MKKILFLICLTLLAVSCVKQEETNQIKIPASEFYRAFDHHQKNGTLFDHQTSRDFTLKRWEKLYRDAITNKFKGLSIDELRLEIKAGGDYEPQAEKRIALDFWLHNDSSEDIIVTTGGTCKTVHEIGYIAIDPQGKLLLNLGYPVAGGHCFCQQTRDTLSAHTSVKLNTKTDSDDVIGWAPSEHGKYVIIGVYHMSTKEHPNRRVFSKPLVLEIRAK